jgi:hypothetical protein
MRIPEVLIPDIDVAKASMKTWEQVFKRIPAPLDQPTYDRIATLVAGLDGVRAVEVGTFRTIHVYSYQCNDSVGLYRVRSQAIEWEEPKEEVLPINRKKTLFSKNAQQADHKSIEERITRIQNENLRRAQRAIRRMPLFVGGLDEAASYFKRPVEYVHDYCGGAQFLTTSQYKSLGFWAFVKGADALVGYSFTTGPRWTGTPVQIVRRKEA